MATNKATKPTKPRKPNKPIDTTAPNGKKAIGRPTDYNPKLHPKLIKALAEQGKTMDEMAKEMGINRATLFRWRDAHQPFGDALKEAKDRADDIVEQSLYRLATGYIHDVQKPMVVGDGDGISHVEIIEYSERIAPNTTAIIYWLKNRRPAQWRDRPPDEGGDSDNRLTIDFTE